jgi:GDP-4-dehydro-6-deoxy-D-mannose reductase
MTTVIVTGATGFAGRHLLSRLAGSARLVGWHRPGGRVPDAAASVEWRPVDVGDRAALRDAISADRPGEIYHLAGATHVAASWHDAEGPLRINALGTHHVLEAVRTIQPHCRVLVVSSAQVYAPGEDPLHEDSPLRPESPYGFSKLAADDLARRVSSDDGLDVRVARPFNHAGPGQGPEFAVSSFARQVAQIERGVVPPEIVIGNVETRRDLTDVRDIVEAYVRIMAAGRPGRAYNVCSGRAWRMADLLEELVRQANVRVRYRIDVTRLRPHDAGVIQGDATRIRDELGWSPAIAVERMLRDTLDWWRSRQ